MRAEDRCISCVNTDFNRLGQHLDRGSRDRYYVPRCGEFGGQSKRGPFEGLKEERRLSKDRMVPSGSARHDHGLAHPVLPMGPPDLGGGLGGGVGWLERASCLPWPSVWAPSAPGLAGRGGCALVPGASPRHQWPLERFCRGVRGPVEQSSPNAQPGA
eukprot:4712988-Amphidinium_carterae.2